MLWKQPSYNGDGRMLTASLMRRGGVRNLDEQEVIAMSNPSVKPREVLLSLYEKHRRKWPVKGAWQQCRERWLVSRLGLALSFGLPR